MQLHQLKSPVGSRRQRKYRGRGAASGLGKTSGRGDNGQRSRSGRGIILGSEGGQMPIIRRIPKVGFHSARPKVYQIVPIEALNCFKANDKVDVKAMKAHQLVGSLRKPVKILGDGDIKKALTVVAHKFSSGAAEKITKAGGKVELIVRVEGPEFKKAALKKAKKNK
jgi:large subunit ribosomal protein L15